MIIRKTSENVGEPTKAGGHLRKTVKMILTYRIISTIIFPFLIIFVYLRKFLKKEDPIRYKEKIFPSTFLNKFEVKKKLIWFHVASVGELQSIIPIIRSLNSSEEKYNFLITSIK